MGAIKFSESIEIDASPEQVFDYTQDYPNRLVWDTFLSKAELLNNATQAEKGVKAWCVAKNGMGMETEYVSFNRPRVTAIKMTKGPFMFKTFAASWTFRDVAHEKTLVTFLYSFNLRFPFTIAAVIVKEIFKRNVRQRLQDLNNQFAEKKIKPE